MKKKSIFYSLFLLLMITFVSQIINTPSIKAQDNTSDLAIDLCGFTIEDLKGWKKVSLKQMESGTRVRLTVSKNSVFAVIMCIDKAISLDQWIEGTKTNLSTKFKEFNLEKEEDLKFHSYNSHKFSYNAVAHGNPHRVKGVLHIVDIDSQGLIVSIAAPAEGYEQRSGLFNGVLELIQEK